MEGFYAHFLEGDRGCGELWAEGEGGLRDTDWYEIVTEEPETFTLTGAFNFSRGILGAIFMRPGEEGSGNCNDVLGTNPFVFGERGEKTDPAASEVSSPGQERKFPALPVSVSPSQSAQATPRISTWYLVHASSVSGALSMRKALSNCR